MEDMTFGGGFCRTRERNAGHISRHSEFAWQWNGLMTNIGGLFVYLCLLGWITIVLSLPSKTLCSLEEIIPCKHDIVVGWNYVCILTMNSFVYYS